MFSLIKFALAFCLSFVLLSIPIQQKPMFYYLNDWATPITQEIFSQSKDVLIKGVRKGRAFGSKMFNNTNPKKDQISTQSSSVHKDDDHSIETHEKYTNEEKTMLKRILKEAR